MNYFTLEEMVRNVAQEVSDVVPVVSLKEAAKKEWKVKLAPLIEHALGRPPELALCTHLDQVITNWRRVTSPSMLHAESWPPFPIIGQRRCGSTVRQDRQRVF